MLVDDHPVVRQGLRILLETESDFRVVGETGDSLQVTRLIGDLKPDVLVLDLMMPDWNGLDVVKTLTERGGSTRVVVLSMHASEAYVCQAFQHGAQAYVLKGADSAALATAIRLAAEGQRYVSPPLSEELLQNYAERARVAGRDLYDRLTTRERQVLQLAAGGRTNRDIAARLAISMRTVEAHRANLMRKLGLRYQAQLVRYALRRGLLSAEE